METNLTIQDKVPHNIQIESDTTLSREQRAEEFRKELEAIRNQDSQDLQEETKETSHEESQQDDSEPQNTALETQEGNDQSDDDDDLETDPKNDLSNKLIPKKRLDKELKKRQELEKLLQAERESRIKYETELQIYNEALKKLNATKKQEEIEPEIDPVDADAHNYYLKKLQALESKINENANTLQQKDQSLRFEQTVNMQAEDMARKNPDFNDAYKYVIDREKENAKLIGIPEENIDAFVLQKLQPIAWHIYNNGGNVAESIYRMARNYGFSSPNNKRSNVNLKAMEKNMQKSSTMIDDIPASVSSLKNNVDSYTQLERFTEGLMKDDGRGVDPNKFRKILNELKK